MSWCFVMQAFYLSTSLFFFLESYRRNPPQFYLCNSSILICFSSLKVTDGTHTQTSRQRYNQFDALNDHVFVANGLEVLLIASFVFCLHLLVEAQVSCSKASKASREEIDGQWWSNVRGGAKKGFGAIFNCCIHLFLIIFSIASSHDVFPVVVDANPWSERWVSCLLRPPPRGCSSTVRL